MLDLDAGISATPTQNNIVIWILDFMSIRSSSVFFRVLIMVAYVDL